jgi:glutamate-1-semialdehyde 2,1-aminomutase
VVGTAAAVATLEIIAQGEALKTIEARGNALMQGIGKILTEAGLEHHFMGLPSMFGIAFAKEAPIDARTWEQANNDLYAAIMTELNDRGALPCPDAGEPWFLCAALSEKDVDDTLNAFEDSVKAVLT